MLSRLSTLAFRLYSIEEKYIKLANIQPQAYAESIISHIKTVKLDPKVQCQMLKPICQCNTLDKKVQEGLYTLVSSKLKEEQPYEQLAEILIRNSIQLNKLDKSFCFLGHEFTKDYKNTYNEYIKYLTNEIMDAKYISSNRLLDMMILINDSVQPKLLNKYFDLLDEHLSLSFNHVGKSSIISIIELVSNKLHNRTSTLSLCIKQLKECNDELELIDVVKMISSVPASYDNPLVMWEFLKDSLNRKEYSTSTIVNQSFSLTLLHYYSKCPLHLVPNIIVVSAIQYYNLNKSGMNDGELSIMIQVLGLFEEYELQSAALAEMNLRKRKSNL